MKHEEKNEEKKRVRKTINMSAVHKERKKYLLYLNFHS